jgi:hypothetical protein
VRSMMLLGALTYLLLHMEWLEDQLRPFAAPGGPDPGHQYISEASLRG